MNEDSIDERVCLEDTFSNASECKGESTIFDAEYQSELSRYGTKQMKSDTQNLHKYYLKKVESKGQVIYLNATKIFACTTLTEGISGCMCVNTTTANEWHHVALVWESGTTSYLYHDGVQVASFTGRI